MRKRFSDFKNCELSSADGVIGNVTDLLLEDGTWTVRYVVVDVKNTFPQRRVLISPAAIASIKAERKLVSTAVKTRQILDSPPLDDKQPISRQYEKALVDHFSWPIYWLGRAVQISPQKMNAMASEKVTSSLESDIQSDLRSASEICGYQIQSRNGPAGVLKDLVIQIESWTVEFVTAEPSTWILKESCMFSTEHIVGIDWSNRQLVVDLAKAALRPAKHPPITGEPFSSHPFRIA